MDKNQPQFQWLLKLLAKNASTFSIMYNIQFKIPNIVFLCQSKIVCWFNMQRNFIKQINKESKDIQSIKDFYLNFYNRIVDTANKDKFKNELFYIQLIKFGKVVTRKISKKDCIKLISAKNEYSYFTNTWVKIFDCFPIETEKSLTFLEIKFNNGKIDVNIKKLDNLIIQEQDYNKNDLEKNPAKQIDKQNIQKSMSSIINNKCEKLAFSIQHYIDSKLRQYKLIQMNLEIILDINQNIHLISAENLIILNIETQVPEPITFLIKPESQQKLTKKAFKCEGQYCEYNDFFNQQMENNNKFIFQTQQNQWDKNNIITNKSLTLDILERNKTIERVINLCNISEQQANKLDESLLFRIRKFYDISMLYKGDYKYFKNINNLYKKTNLCQNCQNIYFNIDIIRNQQLSNQQNQMQKSETSFNNNNISDKYIKQQINLFYQENDIAKPLQKRKSPSRINEQLQQFDQKKQVQYRTVVRSFFNSEWLENQSITQENNIAVQQRMLSPRLFQIHQINDQNTFRIRSKINQEDDESISHRHHVDYNKDLRNIKKNVNRCLSSQQVNKEQFLKQYSECDLQENLQVIDKAVQYQKNWVIRKKCNSQLIKGHAGHTSDLQTSIHGISLKKD